MWTDERVEELKRLWAKGLSSSQIAKQLGGGLTRNGVIGKIHRLGIVKTSQNFQPTPIVALDPNRRLEQPGDKSDTEGMMEFKARAAHHNALFDINMATTVDDLKKIMVGWIQNGNVTFK
jgi:hypothetical protein